MTKNNKITFEDEAKELTHSAAIAIWVATITIVGAILLSAVVLAYSLGYLTWSSTSIGWGSNKVGESRTNDQGQSQVDAVKPSQETAETAQSAAE